MYQIQALMMNYRKRRKICWTKLSHFYGFQEYCESFSMNIAKCLSLIILNNEYLCAAYGQGNVKIFSRKLWWHWNSEYLAQQIFPHLRYVKSLREYYVALCLKDPDLIPDYLMIWRPWAPFLCFNCPAVFLASYHSSFPLVQQLLSSHVAVVCDKH